MALGVTFAVLLIIKKKKEKAALAIAAAANETVDTGTADEETKSKEETADE